MIRIDLKKAYDSVHWEFVKELLTCLKFPSIFITWIMACITTPTFTIHMNRDDFGYFEGVENSDKGILYLLCYLY